MPYGKHRFTIKEDKLAKLISQEYIRKGYSPKRARQIGYATVNKMRVKY